ncbi:MAG: AAA family ATPase [Planctomycetaceae bacterium]|nr:AAA family ATPase [Planctomycetaceae bacterium]
MAAPFITHVARNPRSALDLDSFPGNLQFTRSLNLELRHPVTFFVGENGSGKSTLLEAIAVLAGLPISGGGTNEVGAPHGLTEESQLADALRVGFKQRPKDGYFFRAELQAHFASLLDARKLDPEFGGDPYKRYGGRSLHGMSHGEAFLSVMNNRFGGGLFILDEPETALSPQRQLTLLALMYDLTREGKTQFLVATHSPILLTYPDAHIVSFDDAALPSISFTETQHYQITSGILRNPETYWKHLRESS